MAPSGYTLFEATAKSPLIPAAMKEFQSILNIFSMNDVSLNRALFLLCLPLGRLNFASPVFDNELVRGVIYMNLGLIDHDILLVTKESGNFF